MFLRTLHVLVLLAVSTTPAVALADESGWVYAPNDSSTNTVPAEQQQQITSYLDALYPPPQSESTSQFEPPVEPTHQQPAPQPEVTDSDSNPHVEPTPHIPEPQDHKFGEGTAY